MAPSNPPSATPFRRYHPYQTHALLHAQFLQEQPSAPKHFTHFIFPLDSTASSLPPVALLSHDRDCDSMDAEAYFATLHPLREPYPKPKGSAARRNSSRGYNLQNQLGWPKRVYGEVQQYIHECARELPTVTITGQTEEALRDICAKVHERWAYLGMAYKDNWAVIDFLTVHLGNRTSKAGKTNEKKTSRGKAKRSRKGSPGTDGEGGGDEEPGAEG